MSRRKSNRTKGGKTRISKEIKLAATKEKKFIKACEAAEIPTTKRQYSKWKLRKGLAFKMKDTIKS